MTYQREGEREREREKEKERGFFFLQQIKTNHQSSDSVFHGEKMARGSFGVRGPKP